MFLLRRNNRNYDVIAICYVCYVCYDITRKKFFDVKWKPYFRHGMVIINTMFWSSFFKAWNCINPTRLILDR